jgi:hypothetical protein
VLNYDAMKHVNLKPCVALLGLVVLLSACSGSDENSAATNTNAPQANSNNSAPQPQMAQGDTPAAPNPAPPQVETIPPPTPAEKAAATTDVKPATPPAASNARAPKLVAPTKKIDYGKQPQDKTIVRSIVIKNGGLANLDIESVVPS